MHGKLLPFHSHHKLQTKPKISMDKTTHIAVIPGLGFSWFLVVRNPSVSLSPTLTSIEKVEHHIRIKAHKPIALRFWVESGVSILCG